MLMEFWATAALACLVAIAVAFANPYWVSMRPNR
jgi:hypothetical protein